MEFLKIFYKRKFFLINIFLLLYIALNLFDGDRGLISYFKYKDLKNRLVIEKENLSKKLYDIEKKNELLTNKIDLDYLEILYREKFMFGKEDETVYIDTKK